MAKVRQPAPDSAVPVAAYPGEIFHCTTDGMTYAWDDGRSKWLSIDLRSFIFGNAAALATNDYFDLSGFIGGAHWPIQADATIVGYEVSYDAATYNVTTARTWRIKRNGTNIGSTVTEGASRYADRDMTLDVDIDQSTTGQTGITVQCTQAGNTNPDACLLVIYYRLRRD
jgi:hypothetical protein